jgi:hypothetical protein
MPQGPTALLTGTLSVEDGCIWIRAHGERWLALWPWTVAVTANGALAVEGNGVRIVEGEEITVVGGEYNPVEMADQTEFVEDLIGQPVPQTCTGNAWLVTELLPEPP